MRRFILAALLAVSSAITGLALAPTSQAATVGLSDPQTGRIVSEDPANFTPHALNGTVNSIVQAGDQVVIGGTFTQARSATSSTVITRNRVMAFNATTGAINNNFNPSPNGTVYKVQQTPEPGYVFVAGQFTSAGGGSRNRIFKINATTGAIDNSFTPASLDGQVRDLEVVGNRLWVGGKFTHVGGRSQRALATLNATTGAYDPYFTGVIAGTHWGRPGDTTSVLTMSSNPQNTELVIGGNFTSVDNLSRSQVAKIDIGGASYAVSPWSTPQFTSGCSTNFESYVMGVEYSPNGQFFAVTTTAAWGGYTNSMNGTSGCDVVARFEGGTATPNVRPTWTAYSGGDTTWTVEVTDNVVYAGGHMRWQNNPAAGDAAGQGAVSRPGIAALNALNGMPLSWNPTRTRGVGIQDFLATSQGLWVGSDTDRIGNNEFHSDIALLPLTGGKTLPPVGNANLPNNVYNVAFGGNQLVRRSFDGNTPGSAANAPNGSITWNSTVGAFMVNGVLYTASSNGSLSKRDFDGATYGTTTPVDAADQIVFQTGWHNEVPQISSLFYYNGQIFYTRTGSTQLYRRGFEPESDVVGQQVFTTTTSGFSYSGMRGAFVAGDKFYYANSSGQLFRADWAGRAPVPGTAVQVSGPGQDSANWNSDVLFVYQGENEAPPPPPGNSPPTAVINVTCALLTCNFNSNGSGDSDGTIDSYLWDFGDGTSSTAEDPGDHTYPAAGARTVTLTVTDNDDDDTTATRNISPSDTASPVAFRGSDETNANRTAHTVTVPNNTQAGDAMVLFFTANTTAPTYSAPAGWTQIGGNVTGSSMVGRAYYKVATASDAGSTVQINSSALAKSDMALAVYDGTDPTNPIAANASSLQTATTASHPSPAVDAPAGSKWLVTYWADKTSATTGWTAPSGQVQRSTRSGTSGGHISALLVDSASDVSGSTGDLTATANSASNQTMSFSVVLK